VFARRLGSALACGFLAATDMGAQVASPPEYRVGDIARTDIVTPVALVVLDAERTEQLRQSEAQRVAPVFRHDPEVRRQSEQALRETFAGARGRFLDLLQTRTGRRLLATHQLTEPMFTAAMDAFRTQSPNFPLSRSLAELWALGDSGNIVQERLVVRLSEAASHYISETTPPPNETLNASSVQIVTVTNGSAALDLAMVEARGNAMARESLYSLSRLRQEFFQRAAAADQPTVAFLGSFLKPNCFFEAGLTRQARAQRVEAINSVDRYAAGQMIVRQGQLIDLRTRRALDEFRARTAADRVRTVAEEEKARLTAQAATMQAALTQEAAAQTASVRAQAEAGSRQNHRLITGLGMALAGCALFAVLWFRRGRASALASPANFLPEVAGEANGPNWRERAIAAEARADKVTALMQARVLPHLARWMMGEMLRRLLSQRSALVNSQDQAEREVADLAARLDSVQAPMAERLKAYEQRIVELQSELAAKDEQNRELIKAKIELTRRKLHDERTPPPPAPAWN